MEHKCSNCAYKGEEIIDNLFCPVCGDWILGKKPGKIEYTDEERTILDRAEFIEKPHEIDPKFDVNKDGQVDQKDVEAVKEQAKKIKEKKGFLKTRVFKKKKKVSKKRS